MPLCKGAYFEPYYTRHSNAFIYFSESVSLKCPGPREAPVIWGGFLSKDSVRCCQMEDGAAKTNSLILSVAEIMIFLQVSVIS